MAALDLSAPWPSPAKLNLFLHITGRRADGYHLLQTAFQFIDFCDQLSFTPRSDSQITLSPSIPGLVLEDNLIYRAACLLQPYAVNPGVDIVLDKQLPMGAGLGGGSSNAATTLVALNQIWQCHLSSAQLAELGLQLGADVPIFIHGEAAWAEGVGERLISQTFPEQSYLLLIPDCHVNTGRIFSDADLERDTPPLSLENYQLSQTRNVCEPVTCRLYPPVAQALAQLRQFAPARMTGTGACVFSGFDNPEKARTIAPLLNREMQAKVVQGCNISPLKHRLQYATGL